MLRQKATPAFRTPTANSFSRRFPKRSSPGANTFPRKSWPSGGNVCAPARSKLVHGGLNNWRTYAMKGEWLRAQLGLADRDDAVKFIEESWVRGQQRERIAGDQWNLYEDHTTNPEPHAVEAVGRDNLLALVADGYNGPSAAEMRAAVERGTATTLLLQDPSGQCPPNGRTDDHVFNDVLYQLAFEVMAERAHSRGDDISAGQYRHAAMLSFQSIERWRRRDPPWTGSYYVTKNHFDPVQRVGYQPASNYGNYNGAVMLHLAEAWRTRKTEIAEQPAPTEIGGYALAMDGKFASAVANAGGMQMFAALRADTSKVYDRYWTALGVERFARVGWDSRLGPSDGERESKTGRGVTFAPTWLEDGHWVRMADVPDRYRGKFSVQFTHPLLVRCAIDYAPFHGAGPSFRQEFILTPEGIFRHARCSTDATGFWRDVALIGKTTAHPLYTKVAFSRSPPPPTAILFGMSNAFSPALPATWSLIPRTMCAVAMVGCYRCGRRRRVASTKPSFIRAILPTHLREDIRDHLRITSDGFQSPLGSVHGTLYVGRTSAGGEGGSIDCDGDGKPDATFDPPCRFILQLQKSKITAIEADRETTARVNGKEFRLKAYQTVSD